MAAPQPNSATWVADQFATRYYDVLERLPKFLHRFYKEHSVFSVTDVQADGSVQVETATGNLEAIQEKVISTIANSAVSERTLDAQFSSGDGVLLQVTGKIKLKGVDRRFVQAFFLAVQEKGYYVQTDMLRIYAPEPLRPVENGFVPAPHAAHPPAFTAAPAPAPVVGRSEPPSAMPAGPSAAAAEAPAAAEAAAKAPAAEPSVQAAAPAAAPAAVQQAAPKAPPQHAQAAAVAVAESSSAAAATLQNLTWSERVKLAQTSPAPPAAVAKPATPAKPAAAAAPAVAAAAVDAPVQAEASTSGDAGDAGQEGADMLDGKGAGLGHPGVGPEDEDNAVYVQGIPQNLGIAELKTLLNAEFSKFGAIKEGMRGIKVVRSPRFGNVAYVFYVEHSSVETALAESGKLRLVEGEKPVKIQLILKEFAAGFAQRGGRGGERGRGGGMGERGRGTYRGGHGGYDGGRGGRGRGEGGRGERPPSGSGGRGERGRGEGRSSRGGGPGRGPREGGPREAPAAQKA